MPTPVLERGTGGGETDDRGAGAEQEVGVRIGAEFQQLFEPVGGDLFRGALIGQDLLCEGLPVRVNEPHPAQFRGGGAVVEVADGHGGLGVHDPHQFRGPVGLDGEAQGSFLPAFLFPQRDPGTVEFVTERARFPGEGVGVEGVGGINQLGRSSVRERCAALIAEFGDAKPCPDRLRRLNRDVARRERNGDRCKPGLG